MTREISDYERLERNRKRRERYANDPEFRAKALQYTRDWFARMDPEERRIYQREANRKYEKIHGEDYIMRKRERNRRYKAKKKEEKLRNEANDRD